MNLLNIIEEYSDRLIEELGKKSFIISLKYMRKFYFFIKSQPVADQKDIPKYISIASELMLKKWRHRRHFCHYQELLSIKDMNEIKYYVNEVIKYNLSKRQLLKTFRIET